MRSHCQRLDVAGDQCDCRKVVCTEVALVMDFDDTLAPDTTSALVRMLGGSAGPFWKSLRARFSEGWDPPLAWIPALLQLGETQRHPLTRGLLRTSARRMRLHDGIPDFFNRLREHVKQRSKRLRLRASIGYYVVSGGLEDLLLATDVARHVDEIFGCTLAYDERGRVTGPRSIVSFTEKTKFLFAINKGVAKARLRRNPGVVNNFVPRSMRPVPFENMIYIGDGPTDVPCFSVVTQLGGSAVGIRANRPQRGVSYPDRFEFRPRWGPFDPDYTETSDLSKIVTDLVNGILDRAAGK